MAHFYISVYMVAATEFYDGDWCGIFDVDLTMKVWTPLWWYNRLTGGMTPTVFIDFEEGDYLHRWIESTQLGKLMIISDVDALKDTHPEEYEIYKRLHAQSLIAVPFWKRPTGFLLVRNPKRYDRVFLVIGLSYCMLYVLSSHL